MLVVLDLFVNKTRAGKGIRAVAEDPETASLMGVNITAIIVMTFLVGASRDLFDDIGHSRRGEL